MLILLPKQGRKRKWEHSLSSRWPFSLNAGYTHRTLTDLPIFMWFHLPISMSFSALRTFEISPSYLYKGVFIFWFRTLQYFCCGLPNLDFPGQSIVKLLQGSIQTSDFNLVGSSYWKARADSYIYEPICQLLINFRWDRAWIKCLTQNSEI